MLKELNVDFYRFSLSWTRILPEGFIYKINQAGVDYYNDLINGLLENGIQPVVTIYHWDSPAKFSSLGELSNDVFIEYFTDFARLVFELFGDRVKTWITFNEPHVICQDFNSVMSKIDPLVPEGIIHYLCTHNLIKAHAEAYHIYHKEFKPTQNGK